MVNYPRAKRSQSKRNMLEPGVSREKAASEIFAWATTANHGPPRRKRSRPPGFLAAAGMDN